MLCPVFLFLNPVFLLLNPVYFCFWALYSCFWALYVCIYLYLAAAVTNEPQRDRRYVSIQPVQYISDFHHQRCRIDHFSIRNPANISWGNMLVYAFIVHNSDLKHCAPSGQACLEIKIFFKSFFLCFSTFIAKKYVFINIFERCYYGQYMTSIATISLFIKRLDNKRLSHIGVDVG